MKALKRWSLTRRIISVWHWLMNTPTETLSLGKRHEEMLTARWQDLLYAIDADKITYDEAMEMYEKLRDTAMISNRSE